MIVAVVAISSGAGVLKAFLNRRSVDGGAEVQRQLREQAATIAELQKRVENLELIVTDPAMLAAMEGQKTLKSVNPPTMTPSKQMRVQ
ncbi:MAG: hypothetical protein NZT92_02965 [Abditibacteriales bacterium]|nr:hypothetical protein [Abditibacteriales bacterium]